MDCYNCENEDCIMKTDKYYGTQPCYHCARAIEGKIGDECLICIAGHMCCFKFLDGDANVQL